MQDQPCRIYRNAIRRYFAESPRILRRSTKCRLLTTNRANGEGSSLMEFGRYLSQRDLQIGTPDDEGELELKGIENLYSLRLRRNQHVVFGFSRANFQIQGAAICAQDSIGGRKLRLVVN